MPKKTAKRRKPRPAADRSVAVIRYHRRGTPASAFTYTVVRRSAAADAVVRMAATGEAEILPRATFPHAERAARHSASQLPRDFEFELGTSQDGEWITWQPPSPPPPVPKTAEGEAGQ
jgi:hypothetical protein